MKTLVSSEYLRSRFAMGSVDLLDFSTMHGGCTLDKLFTEYNHIERLLYGGRSGGRA